MKQWFAIYTRSRREKEISAEYDVLGLEHYLPIVRRERRWRGRRAMVDFPLFPSYIFVHEDLYGEDGWDIKMRLLQIEGVVRLLTDPKGMPLPIPDQEIFNVRTVLEQKLKVDPYRFEFHDGQPLRIKKGPLAGVEGVLLRRKGTHRLILQVQALHQAVSVELPAADVEATG